MARPIPMIANATSSSEAGFAMMTLFMCAFALFMCASHKRKLRACYDLLDVLDEEYDGPIIQHNTEAMTQVNFSSQQVGDRSMLDEEQEDDQQVPVWQKNIIMGGKCELPDFSGVIIYDSEGQVVTPAKNNRLLLTWK
ncbi:hypothetical protein ACFE04_005089 [Oxalis oulophora]